MSSRCQLEKDPIRCNDHHSFSREDVLDYMQCCLCHPVPINPISLETHFIPLLLRIRLVESVKLNWQPNYIYVLVLYIYRADFFIHCSSYAVFHLCVHRTMSSCTRVAYPLFSAQEPGSHKLPWTLSTTSRRAWEKFDRPCELKLKIKKCLFMTNQQNAHTSENNLLDLLHRIVSEWHSQSWEHSIYSIKQICWLVMVVFTLHSMFMTCDYL